MNDSCSASASSAEKPPTTKQKDSSTTNVVQHLLDVEMGSIPSPISPLDHDVSPTPLHPSSLSFPTLGSISPPPASSPLPKPNLTPSMQLFTTEMQCNKNCDKINEKSVPVMKPTNLSRTEPLDSTAHEKLDNIEPLNTTQTTECQPLNLTTKTSKKQKPKKLVKTRNCALKKASKSKLAGRRSPPPLAPIQKPLSRIVTCENNTNSPTYFILPATPQLPVGNHSNSISATNGFVVPTRPVPQSCLMMPVKAPPPVIRPQIVNIRNTYGQPQVQAPTPTLITTPTSNLAHAPRLHSQYQWRFPVSEQLPEIAVPDLCQSLQCDDWDINLELQPMFQTTILHGFEYESHCLRPLPFESCFVLGNPRLLQQPEIVSPNLISLSPNKTTVWLPPDIICPPFLIVHKTAPNMTPEQPNPANAECNTKDSRCVQESLSDVFMTP